jgi:hypothetical protein
MVRLLYRATRGDMTRWCSVDDREAAGRCRLCPAHPALAISACAFTMSPPANKLSVRVNEG